VPIVPIVPIVTRPSARRRDYNGFVARAGDSIEDYCRACKLDRMHTVIAADPNGLPIRVACGYCSSEHNYRGGPRMNTSDREQRSPAGASAKAERSLAGALAKADSERPPFPLVSERERTAPPIAMSPDIPDLELLLRRIIREESGVAPVAPAEKWRGGTLVLKPANASQEKSWPIETFFHKVVMIRNRLRSLEQQINAMDAPEDLKVKLQAYISGCYGTLTSFNVLFADEDDQFKGAAD
jgi:hypothetical protein